MFTLAKSAMLSFVLVAGAVLGAHAQSENIAALPPGGGVARPGPIGPSGPYPGPDPGRMWSTQESQTRPVEASPKYVGPDPGRLWGFEETNTGPAQPSPEYVGPAPYSSETGDSD
jgi:hypothetical protein